MAEPSGQQAAWVQGVGWCGHPAALVWGLLHPRAPCARTSPDQGLFSIIAGGVRIFG